MKWVILFVIVISFFPSIAYASHQSTQCTITIQGELIPVLWNNEPRGNPDNSFYPGDAFHYLYTFAGDEECTSFTIQPILSEGIFDVMYHNSILWNNGIEKTHTHTDSEMYPKYMTTFSYHKILESPFRECVAEIGVPNSHKCPKSEDVISENITFSYREDKVLTDRDQKKIKSLKTWCSNFRPPCLGYVLVETENWGFTNMDGVHEHGGYSHTNESDESINSFDSYVKSKCNGLEKYSGCIFGHVELEPSLRDEKCMWEELSKMNISHNIENDFCVGVNHKLSLSIQGTKINCYYKDGKEICETIKVKKTKNITPNILSPEFEIILTDPPVKDRDNYDGKNKDDTYYPHDPIGIIHNPSIQWKDYRAETIQFETSKVYKLSNEYEYDCNSNLCEHKIKLDSVYPALYKFGNGQGITIYNTTSVDFGFHDFQYHSTATNLGNEISSTQNTKQINVVDYFPQYTSYPYPLLFDNEELAFDDRQAVALYYVGSVEGDHIFENRRSKINYAYNVDIGYDPFTPHIIFQNFTLSEGITVTDNVVQSHNGTAVFSESGYGKIYFEHPLSEMVIPDGIAKFENVTSYTTLVSQDFAAKDTIAEFYTIRYTEASFTKNIIIQSINQNGTIMNDDIIHLELTPYDTINTQYITSYIYDKILFDSDDETFAEIISGDTYPMIQKYSGAGMINATISKTSVFFDEYTQQTDNVNATFSENIISDLNSLLDSPDTIRLLAPYDMGLSALSPTTLSITVNDITILMDERYYSFGGKQTILVNTQTDNILYADRDKNKIVIYSPENFGLIDTVFINDTLVEQECQSGCVILHPPKDEIILSVHNKWGGIAHVTLPEIIIPETPISDEPNYMMILAIAILLMLVYIGYKKIRLN